MSRADSRRDGEAFAAFRWARSRVGLKLAGMCTAVIVVAASILVAVSRELADDLGHRAAVSAGEAVRTQAERALRSATAYQTQTYAQQLQEAARLTRGIAKAAEAILRNPSRYPRPREPLEIARIKGYFTTDLSAPASVIAWGSDVLRPVQRSRMMRFAHLDPMLRHAHLANPMIAAAWTMSERRTSRYVANSSLVRHIPPDARNTPLDSPYYRIAKPAANPGGGTRWSDVYQDPAGKGLTITVVTPFRSPGRAGTGARFAGAAGIDLVLNEMLSALKRARAPMGPSMAGSAGFGFLMREDGRLIAFPDEERAAFGLPSNRPDKPGDVSTLDLAEADAPALRRLEQSLHEITMPAIRQLHINGRDYLIGLDRMDTTGWVFANVVPAGKILGPVQATRDQVDSDIAGMTWQLAAITVAGMVLVLFVLLVIFDRVLVRPLNELAVGARRVADGDVMVRVSNARRDELGEVTRAFDHMIATIGAYMHSLEDRVEARTAELREARDRATAADAAKTRFLSAMNHELRSPLNAIIGYADLIQNEGKSDRPDLDVEYAQTIRESGQHLLDMVDDVLAMAKLEHGTYKIAPDWLDVGEVVGRCLRMVQPQADAQGVCLQTALAESMPILHADERTLRQMLLNLLSNALKFAGHGGTVEVTAEWRLDGRFALGVRDTGPGIPEADQARILQPFEQGEDASRGSGTGLGLAITYRLVCLHDGDLVIDSVPGAGSMLTLVFPAKRVGAA
jgi:signal transduction histidine kinase